MDKRVSEENFRRIVRQGRLVEGAVEKRRRETWGRKGVFVWYHGHVRAEARYWLDRRPPILFSEPFPPNNSDRCGAATAFMWWKSCVME